MATYSYTVTASGSDHYLWSGHGLENSPDPDLYFHAGDSLTITNNSGAHPMRISGSGVTIDESGGEIVIASVSAGSYTYVCTTHPTTMTGQITVSAIASDLNPRDGYGTGPLRELPIPLSSLKTKINEIIRKGGIGGGSSVGTTFPTNPSDGDLFYDETTGSLYIYLADLQAWVQTNGGGSGSTGGGNFSTGWVNTDGTNNFTATATLTFDHNLGTTDLTTQIWVADDENGTNAFQVINLYESSFGSNALGMSEHA